MPRLNQKELAARLGLSYATVSRVFNGDTRVTSATRQRVLREAEELGFRGNALARALRLKKSFGIGVVAVNTRHSFWTDVVAAMERRAREAGYHIIICHRERDRGSEAALGFLLDRQIDAVVLSPHPTEEDPERLRDIAEAGTPLLMLDKRVSGFPASYLGTDSFAGSCAATEHLLRLGHRRIACLAGRLDEYTARRRVDGYCAALAESGILDRAPGEVPRVLEAGWEREDGERAARVLLSQPRLPTAVLCANDAVATGLYLGLRRAGLRVPEDVSIVGYSGDPAGELLATPLTTVAQPVERLGERAAEVAISLIEGEPAEPVVEELPDKLVIRASCAPPRAEEPRGARGQ